MKQLFLALFCAIGLNVFAQIPAALVGNWLDEESNEWQYGFFEHFAVYKCDFWQYADVRQKGETTKIVLQKDGKTVSLEVKQKEQKDNLVVSIKNGKEKSRRYVLMHKVYPNYKTKDVSRFPAPVFRQASATITGYYYNFDKIPEQWKNEYGNNFIEISVPNFISEESEPEYRATIDSLGRFSITFPIFDTQQIFADWRRLNKRLIVSPNDTLFLFAGMNDLLPQPSDNGWEDWRNRNKQILVMGDNARINNELIQYKKPFLDFDRYEFVKQKPSDMEYLSAAENAYNQSINFLNDFISERGNVSEKFLFFQQANYKYNLAFILMQHRFDLDRQNNQRFSDSYIEYVNEHFPLYQPEIYTLTREFSMFLDDYIPYFEPPITIEWDSEKIIKILEKEGKLTPEIREDLQNQAILFKKIDEETDSIKRDKLIDSGKDLFEKVSSNDLIMEATGAHFRKAIFDKEMVLADSLIQEPVLKELWTAKQYLAKFEYNRIPFSKIEMEDFESRIKNPYLRDKVLEINDYYIEISNKKIENEESLKSNKAFEQMQNADEIFQKLVEPYKGKVIFIDVWGTWCGPCRANIKKHSKNMEQYFEDKDVIFMYLANNTSGKQWKNFIKENNLTGAKIVHYNLPSFQQSLLEKKLNINSFPTYIIVGKDGNVFNPKVHWYEPKIWVEELEKAL